MTRRVQVTAYVTVTPDRTGWDGQVWSARIAKLTRRLPKTVDGDARVIKVNIDLPASLLERTAIEHSIYVDAA